MTDHHTAARTYLERRDAAPVGTNRCPKCYAQPGTPCRTRTGYATRLHIGRQA